MPNHTHNEMLIETNTNDDQEILALQILKNDLGIEDGKFDFNGVIPMPDELKKGAEMSTEDFLDGKEIKDYELVMGKYVPKDLKIRKNLVLKYGFDNWYDWSNSWWGTKWNAYDVEICEDKENYLQVDFTTAWDSPRGVIGRISKYCKKHNLSLDWSATHEGEEGYEQII